MVHVKNKSLSCDTCGKLFFIPSKLEHHRRTVHEKLKPWQCECCSFRCAAHGNLNLHRRTQHGAEKLTVADYNKLHGIVMEKKPGSRLSAPSTVQASPRALSQRRAAPSCTNRASNRLANALNFAP